jgi:hypothetical protein
VGLESVCPLIISIPLHSSPANAKSGNGTLDPS